MKYLAFALLVFTTGIDSYAHTNVPKSFVLLGTPTGSYVNMISLARANTPYEKASDLCRAIRDCQSLARFNPDTQQFDVFPAQDFELKVGEPYGVVVGSISIFTLDGTIPYFSSPLKRGWNAITVPHSKRHIKKASDLLADIPYAVAVYRWNFFLQKMQRHSKWLNWNVAPDQPYFVEVSNDTHWPELAVNPKLSASPLQATLATDFVIDFVENDSLADDVDVVLIHEDFYGIPWDEFSLGKDAPAYFADLIKRLKSLISGWKKPVYLSLTPVQGDNRSYLADRLSLSSEGKYEKKEQWSNQCFNFDIHPDGTKWRNAYLNYVEYMVKTLKPRFIDTGIEVNMFQVSCKNIDPGAYRALMRLLNDAYDRVKAIDPTVIVFQGMLVSDLMEIRPGGSCYINGLIDLELARECLLNNLQINSILKRDRFALSLYPHLIELGGEIDMYEYLYSVLREITDQKVVIAQTGYPSNPFLANGGQINDPQCTIPFDYTDEDQINWIKILKEAAHIYNMDLLTWFTDRDVLPLDFQTSCPCKDEAGFCAISEERRLEGETYAERLLIDLKIRALQGMGLRNYDGTPKLALDVFISPKEGDTAPAILKSDRF